MDRLRTVSGHITGVLVNPLDPYRKACTLDEQFFRDLQFGEYYQEMKQYERMYLENQIFT